MAKTKTEDRPYVSNYPPLAEWLEKIKARCDWQLPLGTALVEGWRTLRGSTFVLVIHANKKGWDIFTPHDSNKIDATLLDAEHRLGLAPAPAPSEEGVSPAWILNQLAGTAFPSQGGAYDFMKKSLYALGIKL